MNRKEIYELKKYLVDDFHSNRLKEQTEDLKYYNDEFAVPLVKNTIYIVRSGKGRRLIDSPAEHIITSNPQVFRDAKKADANLRVTSELNRWAMGLLRQTPQPYKEYVKNLLLMGEGWIYTLHNDDLPLGWQKTNPEAMPIRFIILDPLNVFYDPFSEEDNGVHGRVIVSHERTVASILRRYPLWSKQGRRTLQDKVPFFMYYDKDIRYVEADEEALLRDNQDNFVNGDGIDENIYGFVPFVHGYSGFGKATAEGDEADLAVGRLRYSRDLLREECTLRSDINFVIHKYAHKTMDIIVPIGTEISSKEFEEYDAGAGNVNVMHLDIAGGAKIDRDTGLPPPQEVFQHLADIEGRLAMEDPPIYGGIATGSSGRHDDIAYRSGKRRYDTVVDNTAHNFATAFGQGLRMCEQLPDWLPPTIKKGDIGGHYRCTVELKAIDPIENDRLRTLGSRLATPDSRGIPQIDWKTNLTKYQGYTDEVADEIMARTMADAVMLSPDVIAILGLRYIKERGMEDYLVALKEKQAQQQQNPLPQGAGSQGGPPREGNIQTAKGREEADLSLTEKGARLSPTG